MDFKELVKTRQATRAYNGKPVEREKLDAILSMARLCPSACNAQPWKIYAVTSPERVKAVREAFQDRGANGFLSDAPAFFVLGEVLGGEMKPHVAERFGMRTFIPYDIGEMAAYLTLAAAELGLSTCILGWTNKEKLREAVGAPEEVGLLLGVAVGYPKDDAVIREKIRKPMEEFVEFL